MKEAIVVLIIMGVSSVALVTALNDRTDVAWNAYHGKLIEEKNPCKIIRCPGMARGEVVGYERNNALCACRTRPSIVYRIATKRKY